MSLRRAAASAIRRLSRLYAHRALASALLLASCAALSAAPVGGAGSTSSAETGTAVEQLIVNVVVNTVDRGDVMALRTPDGRLLVPAIEFGKWGLKATVAKPLMIGNTEYIDPAKVAGVRSTFDAARVTLTIDVLPEVLKATTVDLGTGRNPNVIFPQDTSAFFTYGVSTNGTATFGSSNTQVATEMGGRVGDFLLYNAMQWQMGGGTSQFTRIATNLTYDRRDTLQRLILGDFTATSGALGSTQYFGGISFSKVYRMDPYFIQYPLPSVSAQVFAPSEIQIKVGDTIVDTRRVPPGPFQVNDIQGIFGDRNVTLTVRDAFGRESVYRQPFYYTNLALRQGLHEYSYNAGSMRTQDASGNWDYGDFAVSGFHRYAYTDALSAGLRGEARKGLYNVGAFGTYLSPRFGIAGLGAGVSTFDARTGGAIDAFYSYQTDPLQVNLGAQYFSPSYATLAATIKAPPKYNVAGSVGTGTTILGAFSAGYNAQVTYGDANQRSATALYSRNLFGSKAMVIAWYQRGLEGLPKNNFFLTFNYFIDQDYSVVANVASSSDRNAQLVDLTKSQPQGEGLGFRIGAVHESGTQGSGTAGGGSFQYNGTYATVGGDYLGATSGNSGSARAFVAGSLGYVHNTIVVGRPFDDSFAVVKVDNIEGVPVYLNGQWMGNSNRHGEVVVPSMQSFYDAYITFDDSAIPMDYTYGSAQRVISPPLRSGSYVEFAMHKVRAVSGMLVIVSGDTTEPDEFREFMLNGEGRSVPGFTSRRGAFYAEGLTEGRYELRLLDKKSDCTASIAVSTQDEPVRDIGTVRCETRRK